MNKITLIILLMISLSAYSQKNSLNIEIGALTNYHSTPIYTELSYTQYLKPYMGLSGGILLSSTKLEEHWQNYYIKDNTHIVNGLLSLNILSPNVKKVGIYSDLSFMFDVIPYTFVTVTNSNTESNINKTVFTNFDPSYFIEAGVYIKTKEIRYSIGLTSTSFDPFTGYRKVKIDGNSIANHIPRKSIFWGLTFKISLIDI